jgi:8-amino-7-oxononanoate synthase
MAEYADRLERFARRDRLRTLRDLQSPQGARLVVDGSELLSFSSNDYLGLANHPVVVAAARDALDRYGHGAGAARLLTGNFELAGALERQLADWLGAEASLVLGSGYLANVGVLSALVGGGARLFSDELNHASIIDGCRLSRAAVHVYPHKTVPAVENDSDWIATETVFSMDGDSPDLDRLDERCAATGARLIADEAHALGVVGDGRGLAGAAEVRIGTLGKALGSYGAFVAGSRELIDLLINTARTFVFSTGLPAPTLAAACAAVELTRGPVGDAARARVRELSERLAAGLADLGIAAAASSPIFPVILGSEERALQVSSQLEADGLLVQAIRPPTVPEGSSRLRVVVSASHRPEDIDAVITSLSRCYNGVFETS